MHILTKVCMLRHFSNRFFHKPSPQNSEMLKLVAEPNTSSSAVKEHNTKESLCN